MTRLLNARAGLVAAWLGTLVLGSTLQFQGILPSNYFPQFGTYFPDFPGISLEAIRSILPEKQPEQRPPEASKPAQSPEQNNTPPNVSQTAKELWNRDKDRYLAPVLSKLRARKQTVRTYKNMWATKVVLTVCAIIAK